MSRGGIARSAAVVSFLTLVSRVLGMIRDVAFAYTFGAGQAWDAFVIAFAIPNLFRHLFGEGALASAFLPAFVGRLERSREEARTLLRALCGSMIVILGVLTAAAIGVTFLLEALFEDPKLALTMRTLRITLPYAPLICITAVFGAALNGLRRFAIPALAPVLLNVVLIATIFIEPWSGGDWGQLQLLAWAVVVGGVAQLGSQVPSLVAGGMAPTPSGGWRRAGLWEVARGFLPAVAGLAVIQVNEALDNVIAELFVAGDGAVSAIYFGNRLNQLPLALIGFSLATAAFPSLASHAARDDTERFQAALRRALELVFFVAVPAAVGLAVLSHESSRLLFQRGEFDAAATGRTATVVIFLALGLPFYSANMVLTRAFYSLRDMATPVRISLTTVGLNLLLNLVLVWPLAEGGIALATSVTGVLNFMLLARALAKRVPLGVGSLAGRWASIGAAAGVMAGAVVGLRTVWAPPNGTWGLSQWMASAIAGGLAVYLGCAALLRALPRRGAAS